MKYIPAQFLSILLVLLSSHAYATDSPFLASGIYVNSSGGFYPMLASFQNDEWSYGIDSQSEMPTNFSDQNSSSLSDTHCVGNNCVAVGYYSSGNDSPIYFPLIANSSDGGQSWDYTVESGSNLPSDLDNTNPLNAFNQISCHSTECIAVGQYESSTKDTITPLLYSSTDMGLTWSTANQILPDDYLANGQLTSAECFNDTCIVAGIYYNESGNTSPMILTQSGSSAWTVTLDSQQIPSDYETQGEFVEINCTNNFCMAAGSYISNDNVNSPLIVISQDNGATWTYETIPNITMASIEGASCTDTSCIVSGSYFIDDTRKTTYLFIATGTLSENTITWTVTFANTEAPVNFILYGTFVSASCSDKICITSGYYLTPDPANPKNQIVQPILTASTDQGKTWTHVVSGGNNTPTDFTNYGMIWSVNCQDLTCVAAGEYNNSLPLLIMTTDGQNWSYQVDSTTNIPSDLETGAFTAVGHH